MKYYAVLILFILTIGSPGAWSVENRQEPKIELVVAPTILFSFNKDANGVYQFQGPPPGLYVNLKIKNLLFENDFFKTDPAFYYIGIGYLVDHTIQYGAGFMLGNIKILPTIGFGYNLGKLPDTWEQLYIPISIEAVLYESPELRVAVWGQLQNYFWTNGASNYYLGGKVAADIYINFDQKSGLALQPIFGLGGSQMLFGLRAGVIFYM